MRSDAMEKRLRKLEVGKLPTPSYVVRLTRAEQKLPDVEQRALIAERAGGRCVMVGPEVCATTAEWIEQYARPALENRHHV